MKNRVSQLHEANPMLGHRGDRLAVTYPEILEMQVRAIIEAACECKKQKIQVLPEIMIPLAGTRKELDYLKKFTDDTARAVMKEQGVKVNYLYGTMIEVPRAAVTADELAQTAEFFSFGTNDLTQMTFGFSRDDVNSFLPDYLNKEILDRDPFQSIDIDGVGALVRMAVHQGSSQPSRPQVRHLRRARRRPQERPLLQRSRPQLRELLPLPRPHRPPGGCPGGNPGQRATLGPQGLQRRSRVRAGNFSTQLPAGASCGSASAALLKNQFGRSRGARSEIRVGGICLTISAA